MLQYRLMYGMLDSDGRETTAFAKCTPKGYREAAYIAAFLQNIEKENLWVEYSFGECKGWSGTPTAYLDSSLDILLAEMSKVDVKSHFPTLGDKLTILSQVGLYPEVPPGFDGSVRMKFYLDT